MLADPGRGDERARLRPTSDRVRESVFNLLVQGRYGDPITNARVLDLFAGSGALGFEALSRGAAHATFVDDGARALALLRRNIGITDTRGRTRIWRRDATRLGPNRDAPYTLIFLDPPYGQELGERALAAARTGGWLATGALVVWEDSATHAAPEGFAPCDQRRYGDTFVTILRTNAAME